MTRSPPCHRPPTTSVPNLLSRLSLVDDLRRRREENSIARTQECSSQVPACRPVRGRCRSLRAEGGQGGAIALRCKQAIRKSELHISRENVVCKAKSSSQ